MSTWRIRRIMTVQIAKCRLLIYCRMVRYCYRRRPHSANQSAICIQQSAFFSDASIYLHDEGSRKGSSSRYQSARGYLAVVLLWCQDRCARAERRRQELVAEDHVGRGSELHRRSMG